MIDYLEKDLDLEVLFKKEFNNVCDFVMCNMDLNLLKNSNSDDFLFNLKNMFYVNVNFNIQNNKEYYKINEIRKDLIKKVGYYDYINIEKGVFDLYYTIILNKKNELKIK